MKQLLANPFERFGGAQALGIGLVIITITTLLAFFGQIHLDGTIDLHTGSPVTLAGCVLEALTDWLSLSVCAYIAGLILSKSSIRLIDVLGTQAMARFPFLIATGFSWLLFSERIMHFIEFKFLHRGEAVEVSGIDWLGFIAMTAITIACIIWMIVLMYRAYSVACNVKGTKAIVSFIVCLLLAEIASKLILVSLHL